MTVSTETAGARDGLRAIVRQALATLNPQERLRYRIAVVVQVLLSLLDLVGVLLLGVVGYLLASGGTGALPEPVASVIDRLGTSNESTALALAAIAAVVLLVKSSTALLIQSRITRYLGQRSGLVGSDIARRFLQQPLLEVQSWSSQKVTYALLEGVTGLIVGVLGSYMIIISEISLLVVLTAGLLLVDPLTAIVAVGYFGVIGIGLGRWLRRRSRSAGAATTESAVASRIAAHSALETLPETTVMNRRRHFLDEFSGSRMQYATSRSEALVLGLIPRFGMEAALVVGAGLTAMTLWLTGDRTSAIAGLALFIAAAMRLMPALLRLHAAYITLHNQAAAAWTAYDLASALDEGPSLRVSTTSSLVEQSPLTTIGHSDGGSVPAGFTLDDNATLPNSEGRRGATVLVENVNLYYPDSPTPALRSVDLSVEPGRSLALAGPTGSGKSSLIAVILGLIEPQSGRVLIDGVDPRQLVSRSANAIGYVPQAVALIDASVRDNVALALDAGQVHDESVWAALRKAHLADFVAALPAGLDTQIGERGVRLSGGQRQRVGLARALYRTPRLLVLDEATSALDAETERVVADTLKALEGNVTTITVAHRLATIRHVDSVAYIESGQLIAVGTFDEVRQMVPGFERQANLLGL